MKFTENEFKHETSFNINDLSNSKYDKINNISDVELLYKKYEEIIEYSKNKFDNFESAVKEINNFIVKKNLKNSSTLSFALSVLAQRILTMNIQKNIDIDIKNQIINLDILSILLGAENLSSISRLIKFIDLKIINLLKSNDYNDIFYKKERLIQNYLN